MPTAKPSRQAKINCDIGLHASKRRAASDKLDVSQTASSQSSEDARCFERCASALDNLTPMGARKSRTMHRKFRRVLKP